MAGEIGRFAVLAAVVTAAYGILVTVLGIRRRHEGLLEAGRRAAVAWALLVALAAAALWTALVQRDFSVRFVAVASESTQPLFYTITAFWGGHDGALLLWALVLAGYLVAGVRALRAHPALQAPATVVLLAVALFFSGMLAWASDPFARLVPPPPDGQGLNPLLRNPWMAAHPPTLYLGFVGMTVPFAIVVAALVTGRLDDTWVVLARRWVLVGWIFLSLGLLFGAKWSYVVLGWGGYWAWDPVENAALMPWLVATAFLHSIQVQERRGLLATWNVALVILAFALTLFGTFLVRSGVIASVHAFALSAVGPAFLGFLAVVLLAGFGLLAWRWDQLRRPATIEAVLSRETAFLANNLLLVAATAVVFVGTVFPAVTEALEGVRSTVGPPYFNRVLTPIALALLLLMAIGPLLPWRRASREQLVRTFAWPAAVAAAGGGILAAAGVRAPVALGVFVLALFVLATIGLELVRGVRVRAARGEPVLTALGQLLWHNRRRYGGYAAHLGVVLMLAGIAGSSAFATQQQATVAPGERFQLGAYLFEFRGLAGAQRPGIDVVEAEVRVWRGARDLGVLRPRRLFYRAQEQPMHEVAIRSSPREDLYAILADWTPDGRATLRVLIHPLVSWLWAGGAVLAAGALLAALPERRRQARVLPVGEPAPSPAVGAP
ncbi:MAG: heme lyase CcmF/NrfE family subunit [Armatimonadota bacterium]|nr:heme lyase CcmF/NrfE family subunit [Armatimonadota bacterium]